MKRDKQTYAVIGATMEETVFHDTFYQEFLNCDALRHGLSWARYSPLLPGVNSDAVRRKSGASRSLEIGCAVSNQSIPHAMPTSSWICHAIRGGSALISSQENEKK